MSKVQSVGYSYNQTALKSSRGLAYQNYKKQDQDSVEFRTQKQVSFGAVATPTFLGRLFSKAEAFMANSREVDRIFAAAEQGKNEITNWAKSIEPDKDYTFQFDGKKIIGRVDSKIRKSFLTSIDEFFERLWIADTYGGERMKGLIVSNPEIKPVYREFFTKMLKKDEAGNYPNILDSTESFVELYTKCLMRVSK